MTTMVPIEGNLLDHAGHHFTNGVPQRIIGGLQPLQPSKHKLHSLRGHCESQGEIHLHSVQVMVGNNVQDVFNRVL